MPASPPDSRTDPASIANRGRHTDAPARIFSLLVWAVMLHLAFSFVTHHTGEVPFGDDWVSVPVYSDARPASLSWLCE